MFVHAVSWYAPAVKNINAEAREYGFEMFCDATSVSRERSSTVLKILNAQPSCMTVEAS